MIRPELPPLEELTGAERRWLGMRLQRLRDLRGMTLGTFAEAVVAEALPGALEAEMGTALVDISWRPSATKEPIAVEVKYSRGGCWGVGASNGWEKGVRVRRRRADVYVLANHEGDNHRIGWTFYVVSRTRLDDLNRSTLSVLRLGNWGVKRIEASKLPAAVRAAAQVVEDCDRDPGRRPRSAC